MQNFIITGFDKTGSAYLADTLDGNNGWTVRHNPRGVGDTLNTGKNAQHKRIMLDFDEDLYGEVSPNLRYWPAIKVAKKGIIVRNPMDNFLSVANAHPAAFHRPLVNRMCEWYRSILSLANTDQPIRFIHFELMTKSVSYVQEIGEWCGIGEIDANKIKPFEAKNVNNNKRYRTLAYLPAQTRQFAEIRFKPFEEKLMNL